MNDQGTVRELSNLYSELRKLDGELSSLVSQGKITKVAFPVWTPTFSGPAEYCPERFAAQQIANLVIGDMCEVRRRIVKQIESFGFVAPAEPSLTAA